MDTTLLAEYILRVKGWLNAVIATEAQKDGMGDDSFRSGIVNAVKL
jgi:hypothetical protein